MLKGRNPCQDSKVTDSRLAPSEEAPGTRGTREERKELQELLAHVRERRVMDLQKLDPAPCILERVLSSHCRGRRQESGAGRWKQESGTGEKSSCQCCHMKRPVGEEQRLALKKAKLVD